MEKIEIRRAVERDLDAVMCLWLAGNLQAHSFVPEAYWQGHFEGVREAVARSEVYLGVLGEEIVGFIGLDGRYIAGLFVAQAHRGKGVGRQLLNYVKAKKETLALQVYRQNEDAVRFYRREGFAVCAQQCEEETGQAEYTMGWQRG